MPDQITPGPIEDGFSVPIFKRRAHASPEKSPDDLKLRGLRLFRTASTAARVLDRQVEGSGTRFVLESRIAPRIEKTLNSGGAPRADGEM